MVGTVNYAMSCSNAVGTQRSTSRQLCILNTVIVILVILLLSSTLKDIQHTVLALIGVPLYLINNVMTIFLTSPNALSSLFKKACVPPVLSITSVIKFIAIVNFTVHDNLVLLGECQTLRRRKVRPTRTVQRNSLRHIIPVVVASLAAILKLLPLV